MITPLVSIAGNLSTTVTQYMTPTGTAGWVWQTTSATSRTPVAVNGVIQNFYVKLTAAPGAGTSRTFKIFKNGVASGISVTISDAATTGSDTTNSVAVVAGDDLCIESTLSGSVAVGKATWGFEFRSNSSIVFSGNNGADLSSSASRYFTIQTGRSGTSSEAAESPVSPAGVFRNLYVRLNGTAGSGKSYTFSLYKNGSVTSLATSVSGASATTNSDTTNSVSVSAGDRFWLQADPVSTPLTRRLTFSMEFSPNTAGESIGTGVTNITIAANLTRYFASGAGSTDNTETNWQQLIGTVVTVKNLYCYTNVAPGGTDTNVFMFRQNAGDTTLTATITGAAQSNNDTTHTVTTAINDGLNMRVVTSATAATSTMSYGVTYYVDPGIVWKPQIIIS